MNNSPKGFNGAAPRLVSQKQKYKDPYGETGIKVDQEYVPQNICFDKRVFRGSTNAAMIIPSGSYPDQLFKANKDAFNPKKIEH
jgi:hypothetical protein